MDPPSPTLTNPEMILPSNSPASEETTPFRSGTDQLPTTLMGSGERHARTSSNEQRSRPKQPSLSLSPFRNGILTRQDSARAGTNGEKNNSRIKYENSKLVYRPNGHSSQNTSPILGNEVNEEDHSDANRLTETPEQEDFSAPVDYRTPSVLNEDENDPKSHAAMTRSAEETLANAKQQLTVRALPSLETVAVD